jgi:hypothetical protein
MAVKHQPPKFRVLRQAWRDYLAEDCVIAVILPVDVATAGQVVASGTMVEPGTTDLLVTLVEDEVAPRTVKGQKYVLVDQTTGAWTVTFTGVTPAGAHKLMVGCGMQPSIDMETSSPFTVT